MRADEQKLKEESGMIGMGKIPLNGASIYAANCNRCHPDRFPVERIRSHGNTILIHMRVRANLPAEQAKQVLQYMEKESGD